MSNPGRRYTDKSPVLAAVTEINEAEFIAKVEREKQKILTKEPWYAKFFPYRIKLERITK